VTGSQKHRDLRFPPFAFTEHGAIMAATILNSPRAVAMSLHVVRAFVFIRDVLIGGVGGIPGRPLIRHPFPVKSPVISPFSVGPHCHAHAMG